MAYPSGWLVPVCSARSNCAARFLQVRIVRPSVPTSVPDFIAAFVYEDSLTHTYIRLTCTDVMTYCAIRCFSAVVVMLYSSIIEAR